MTVFGTDWNIHYLISIPEDADFGGEPISQWLRREWDIGEDDDTHDLLELFPSLDFANEHKYRDFSELAKNLPPQSTVVFESASPSFPVGERANIVQKLESEGHECRKVRSSSTPIARKRLGFPKKGASEPGNTGVRDDIQDALAILALALPFSKYEPGRFAVCNEEWRQLKEITSERWWVFRNHYVSAFGKRGQELSKKEAIQVSFASELNEMLPTPEQLSTRYNIDHLVDGGSWSPAFITVLAWAAFATKGLKRSAYDEMASLYGQAYPKQSRATLKRQLKRSQLESGLLSHADTKAVARYLRHPLTEVSDDFYNGWLRRVGDETGTDLLGL